MSEIWLTITKKTAFSKGKGSFFFHFGIFVKEGYIGWAPAFSPIVGGNANVHKIGSHIPMVADLP